jgi:hypothetical protein
MQPLRHFERRVRNVEGNERGHSHNLLPSTLCSREKNRLDEKIVADGDTAQWEEKIL